VQILQPENGVSQIKKYCAAEVEQTILSSVNNTALPTTLARIKADDPFFFQGFIQRN